MVFIFKQLTSNNNIRTETPNTDSLRLITSVKNQIDFPSPLLLSILSLHNLSFLIKIYKIVLPARSLFPLNGFN